VRPSGDLAFAALLAVALHAAVLLLGAPEVLDGRLVDADCYLRLMRLEVLLSGGGWYNGAVPLINAPEGLVMHWTRPFDLLILLVALPFLVFLPLPAALFWAGAFVSPLLQVVAAMTIVWAARPLLGRGGAWLAVVLFLAQPAVYGVFQIGRADHHSLLLVLAILVVCLLVRWSLGARDHQALTFCAGLGAALGLWVGPEAMMTVAVGGGALGLMWLIGERGAARALGFFGAGLVLGTVLAFVAERPPSEWADAELDRLSLVHVVLVVTLGFATALIVWSARRQPQAGFSARLLLGAGAACVPLVVMGLLFPGFFAGPYGEVPQAVREVFLANVQEAEPLFDRGRTTLADAVFSVGPLLFAVPFALFAAGRRRLESGAWLVLALAMVLFFAASLHQVRVLGYLQALMVIPWAGAAVAAAFWAWRRGRRPWRAPFTALILVGILVSHVVLGALLLGSSGRAAIASWEDRCDWSGLGEALTTINPPLDGAIATMVFPGPELAWRSAMGVVSAPYHRNRQGILDVHALFLASPELAQTSALARDIGVIILCERAPGRGGHDWYLARSAPNGLYARLAAGDPPEWLVPVDLPEAVDDGFLVYRLRDSLD
jgi:asparagine N-glycosylation enzyme membrane subunit Stt3